MTREIAFINLSAEDAIKLITPLLKAQNITSKILDETTVEFNGNDLENFINELEKALGDKILKENVFITLLNLLKDKNLSISFAESCTGGLCAYNLVRLDGASSVFAGSMITYSEEIKSSWLQIGQAIIAKYGVVSEETAKLMAYGILKNAKSNIAIATTGIAGPSGGTIALPVGTVYVAIAYDIAGVINHKIERLSLKGNREEIQNLAVKYAYSLAIQIIKGL